MGASADLMGPHPVPAAVAPRGDPLDLDGFLSPRHGCGVIVLLGAVVPDHRDFDGDRLALGQVGCGAQRAGWAVPEEWEWVLSFVTYRLASRGCPGRRGS